MRPYTGRGKAGHMAAQAAQQEGTGFIYGKNAVAELLKSGTGADTVYIQDTMAPREAAYYTALVKQAGAVAKRVRAQKLDAVCGTQSHQGVAFVYCADMGGTPLEQQNLTGPVALVLGSEGKGPSRLVKSLCDGVVSLSMAARGTGVDSFNVSVAAGIVLYEIMRRRA